MEKKLQVKDLRISFRTSNGKVQAVRGINFDLEKGETLAIVGESGSGKSVTSKAILGILAGNSIVEGGEIIYDGKDLLKIGEDDFHKIRGDKIAMIFQDPMSSLNPIVKIGKQLTEAMILKGKSRQKENRKNFNAYLKNLESYMVQAGGDSKEMKTKCASFNKFEYKHLELESAYNTAYQAAVEALDDIGPLSFEISKHAAKDLRYRVKELVRLSLTACHPHVIADKAAVVALTNGMTALANTKKYGDDLPQLQERLSGLKPLLEAAVAKTMPNYFAMGYCKTFGVELPESFGVEELNAYMRKALDDKFMLDFIADARNAVVYSAEKCFANKVEAIRVLQANRSVFEGELPSKKETVAICKEMITAVEATIDPLAVVKESLSFTFRKGIMGEVSKYYTCGKKNAKEQKRYDKEQAKHDKKAAKGKEPDWKVVPAAITDPEVLKQNILNMIDRLIDLYTQSLENKSNRDYDAETVAIIDYLKECASGVVHHVTKRMAKYKAIKLMQEVGIAEPRKRYNQYPFEFSGGMRQRIVIAIALAADPDILICDEPTTALDVTIQSQILELINSFKARRKLSIIFITHDLGVVANMADRIAVMYAGKIVECGTAEDVFYESAHPYTWALLSSMPDLDTKEKLDAIPGTPPDMVFPPKGDAFAARNKYAMKIDFERQPPMFKISDTHYAATWLLHPDAPKVDPPKIITDRIARMKAKRNGGAQDGE